MDNKFSFEKRLTVEQVEEGIDLAPKFGEDGLISCVTTAFDSGEVLMLGYMNEIALKKTIITREAYYWSRSRKCLWRKGETSGLIQRVRDIYIDDDQDAIWLKVIIEGDASCHVGYKSCFYRAIGKVGADLKPPKLKFVEDSKTFDPKKVYGDIPNPTQL